MKLVVNARGKKLEEMDCKLFVWLSSVYSEYLFSGNVLTQRDVLLFRVLLPSIKNTYTHLHS